MRLHVPNQLLCIMIAHGSCRAGHLLAACASDALGMLSAGPSCNAVMVLSPAPSRHPLAFAGPSLFSTGAFHAACQKLTCADWQQQGWMLWMPHASHQPLGCPLVCSIAGPLPCPSLTLPRPNPHPIPAPRFVLFFVTMKRQIMHMIKYRYVPFSFGKKVSRPLPFLQAAGTAISRVAAAAGMRQGCKCTCSKRCCTPRQLELQASARISTVGIHRPRCNVQSYSGKNSGGKAAAKSNK